MRGTVNIVLEVSDKYTASDLIEMLELTLPYIADNVFIQSDWVD